MTDINDNIPVFDPVTYTVVVSESSLIAVEVVTVTASDKDSSSNAYSITKGNTNSDFTIDPVKGKITVAKGLDIERTLQYDLEIVVKDKGTPSRSATVRVQLFHEVICGYYFGICMVLLGNCPY